MAAQLEIYTLGGHRFVLGGKAFGRLSTRKVEALAMYLACTGRPQPREVLADLLWDDRSQSRALSNLRVALSNLRKYLSPFFSITRDSAALNLDADVWLDVAELESLLAGDRGDGASFDENGADFVEKIEAAAALYKGEFLQGFHIRGARGFEEWVTVERERFHQLTLDGLRRLVAWNLENANYSAGIVHAQHWLQLDPFDEAAHQQMIRLLAYNGQPGAALNQYQECLRLLSEELGLPPSGETILLYEAIQAGSLAPPERVSRPEPIVLGEQEASLAFLSQERSPVPLQQEPFVGREKELISLEGYLQQALEGHGRVAFVTGEAGQGKTTLLREFARQAHGHHANLIVASGACPVYTPIFAPYGLFRELLEMLTGDVESAWLAGTVNREQALRLWQMLPEMIDTLLQYGPHLIESLVSIEGLGTRARSASVGREQMERLSTFAARIGNDGNRLSEQGDLFVEYADFLIALSNQQPLLLILDDLHWADPSSIGLLAHLSHRLSEGGILLTGAYRPEEVNQGREGGPHPLVSVLGEFKRRFGQVLITLDATEAASRRSFIDALLDKEKNALGEAFRQALTRHTEGHPLFTVELLRHMRERGALLQDEAGQWVVGRDLNWDVVPPRVESVIESRIGHLDHELRQWLDLASVEGEAFTAEVIAQTMGVDVHPIVNRLSKELDRQYRLVTAQGIRRAGAKRLSTYQFRHNLFRQYLYNQFDDIERSYLHQQVGEALELLFGSRTNEIADQLAHHFQMADLPEKTMIYLAQAGDNAAHVYAYNEAKDYYEQAISLARELDEDDRYGEKLTDLFTKLGRTLEHDADTGGALAVYREMEMEGRSRADQPMILKALAAQGVQYSIPSPVHNPKQGQVISERALALAQELGDRATEAMILWNLMTAYGYDNQLGKAVAFGERSLVLARQLRDQRQLASTLADLSGWYWVEGRIARARELSREAVEIRRNSHNLPMLADVLIQSSFASMFGGDYDEAIALSDEGWQISQSIGNKWNLAFSRSRIGFAHRARGELGFSVEVAEESLRLGETEDLPNPQVFASAELAFDYAYLGVTSLGLETIRAALNVASEKVPLYRPYLLAALAENHIMSSDLAQAEAAILQARSDPSWQAFPTLCIALVLAEVRLALIRADYNPALQLGDGLLDWLRRFGVRSYIPDLLDLLGQALFKLGRTEEARTRLMEAREEAESMGAKANLWSILLHLSQLEGEPEQAAQLRRSAWEIIDFIANNAGRPEFRESFLALPEVRAVFATD